MPKTQNTSVMKWLYIFAFIVAFLVATTKQFKRFPAAITAHGLSIICRASAVNSAGSPEFSSAIESRENQENSEPAAWKAVAAFCEGLADETSNPP